MIGSRVRVGLFTALLAAAAAIVGFSAAPALAGPDRDFLLPWWAIAIGFALAERFVCHIDLRENAHSFSLNELPLVAGLAFAEPLDVVVARVAGGLIVLVLVERQSPRKLLFNASLFSLEAVTAVVWYGALVRVAGDGFAGRTVAVFATTIIVNLMSSAAIATVIRLASGRRDRGAAVQGYVAGIVTTLATTALAVAAVELAVVHLASLFVVAILAAVLAVGYKAYAALRRRYAALQRLYEFTGALARSGELDSAVRAALVRAREVMRARVARLYLTDGPDSPVIAITTDGHDVRTGTFEPSGEDWPWTLASRGQPVVLTSGDRSPQVRSYLESRRMKDLLMSPMIQSGTVTGVLSVCDRDGDVETFDEEDRKVFATLANHAGASIQNARLIDRLRDELASRRHQASHDSLTGLGNRQLLVERTDGALQTASAAVLLLDLNRFKDVNDSLGHHAGDQLLRQVAERLAAVAEPAATVCRLGGDEFAVVLPDAVDRDRALAVAESIERALLAPFSLEDLTISIDAAIGVAMAPDHGKDAATLLRHADVAMYQSKESRVTEIYDPTRDQGSARRLALAVQLREALASDGLEVHFQPKVSLATGEVVGAEALLRWDRAGYGRISPDEFIPVAESTGLMASLTRYVLRRALEQSGRWMEMGWPIGVAVNLSARSIMDRNLPEEISMMLAETGMPATNLTLEITETQMLTDPVRTLGVLERLGALGVTISIDDFGTGYSSLSYLQRLPASEIKIDKSFVLTMEEDRGSAAIVRSVIDLAGNLGLRVVAEGVETKGVWDLLASVGCDVAQGYLMSRPLPGNDFAEWLAVSGLSHDLPAAG